MSEVVAVKGFLRVQHDEKKDNTTQDEFRKCAYARTVRNKNLLVVSRESRQKPRLIHVVHHVGGRSMRRDVATHGLDVHATPRTQQGTIELARLAHPPESNVGPLAPPERCRSPLTRRRVAILGNAQRNRLQTRTANAQSRTHTHE